MPLPLRFLIIAFLLLIAAGSLVLLKNAFDDSSVDVQQTTAPPSDTEPAQSETAATDSDASSGVEPESPAPAEKAEAETDTETQQTEVAEKPAPDATAEDVSVPVAESTDADDSMAVEDTSQAAAAEGTAAEPEADKPEMAAATESPAETQPAEQAEAAPTTMPDTETAVEEDMAAAAAPAATEDITQPTESTTVTEAAPQADSKADTLADTAAPVQPAETDAGEETQMAATTEDAAGSDSVPVATESPTLAKKSQARLPSMGEAEAVAGEEQATQVTVVPETIVESQPVTSPEARPASDGSAADGEASVSMTTEATAAPDKTDSDPAMAPKPDQQAAEQDAPTQVDESMTVAAVPPRERPQVESETATRPRERPETETSADSEPAPAQQTDMAAVDQSPVTEAAKSDVPMASSDAPAQRAEPPQFDVVRAEATGEAVLAGRGSPGAEIEIRSNGKVVATVKANENSGEWVAILMEPLPPGTNDLSATARLGDGPRIESEDRVAVAIPERGEEGLLVVRDRPGEASEVLAGVAPAESGEAGSQTQAPGADAQIAIDAVESEGDTIYVAGSGRPGARIAVYADNTPLGETRVGETGRWLYQSRHNLGYGDFTIRADQADAGGTVGSRAEVAYSRPREVAAAASSADDSAARADTAAATEPESIIIRRGDNLWTIARRTYGRGIRYTMIYEANTDQIRNPHLIYPGQVFMLPDMPKDNSAN